MAARLENRMKGYDVFAKAARLLLSRRPNAIFVCAGEGAEPHRSEVLRTLQDAGLGERLVWRRIRARHVRFLQRAHRRHLLLTIWRGFF